MPPQIPGAQDLQQSALSNFAHSSAVVRPQTETDLKNPSSQSVIAINIHFPFSFFFFLIYAKRSWQRKRSPSNKCSYSSPRLFGVSTRWAARRRQPAGAEQCSPSRAMTCHQGPPALCWAHLLGFAMSSGSLQLVPALTSFLSLFLPMFQGVLSLHGASEGLRGHAD